MTVRTSVHEALDRIDEECEHVSGELDAFDRFDAGVRDLEPVVPVERCSTSTHQGGGTVLAASPPQQDAGGETTAQVRELFAETVRPYSVADIDGTEPLVKTMAEELGEGVATALAPSTPGEFTPEVKAAIGSAVDQRRAELRVMDRALEVERASMVETRDHVETVADWLVTTSETPWLQLGFEDLRKRHERLETFRTRCDTILEDRQEVLSRTTGHNGTCGLTHRSAVGYLYRELPTPYPVLSTVVRLEGVCADQQRHVRDHLTRRV